VLVIITHNETSSSSFPLSFSSSSSSSFLLSFSSSLYMYIHCFSELRRIIME
jgi:hypothetical protein